MRIIKPICAIAAALSYILAIGAVGGMDLGTVDLLPGAIQLAYYLALAIIFQRWSGGEWRRI